MRVSSDESAKLIREGKIGVIPTDTLYGLVASASDPAAVARVYQVRGRDTGKPCIVLIGDETDLGMFGVDSGVLPDPIGRWWPGKVSIVFPCSDARWSHLHRGTGTIAFRVPDVPKLRAFLREAGPIIAPSANPQGKPPAKTVAEARGYFGDETDFYVDGGTLDSEPSTIVTFGNGTVSVVRAGAMKISDHGS